MEYFQAVAESLLLYSSTTSTLPIHITWNGIQLLSRTSVGRAGGGTDLAGCGSVAG